MFFNLMVLRYNAVRMATTNPAPPVSSLTPPHPTRIAETVRSKLPFHGTFASLTPLAGDASNRRYFRVGLKGTCPSSVILMQLAEAEGFKQSEEAVSGASVQINELPFTNVRSHLEAIGVAVPSCTTMIVRRDCCIWKICDITLAEACHAAERSRMETLYRRAVEGLVLIQAKGTSPRNAACIAFHRGFDAPLLMWEFEHFMEYGVLARQESRCALTTGSIRQEFQKSPSSWRDSRMSLCIATIIHVTLWWTASDWGSSIFRTRSWAHVVTILPPCL